VKYGIEDIRVTAVPQFIPSRFRGRAHPFHLLVNLVLIRIAKKLTGKDITLNLQLEIIGEEGC